MSFLEAFFSTDRVIYSIISSFLCGLLIIFLFSFYGIVISDITLAIVMAIGFIFGNIFKANKIISGFKNFRKNKEN